MVSDDVVVKDLMELDKRDRKNRASCLSKGKVRYYCILLMLGCYGVISKE